MNINRNFVTLVAVFLIGAAATAGMGVYGLDSLHAALDEVVHTDLDRFLLVTDSRRLMRSYNGLEKDVGVMVWIVKPFKAERLLAGIAKVLGAAKTA